MYNSLQILKDANSVNFLMIFKKHALCVVIHNRKQHQFGVILLLL